MYAVSRMGDNQGRRVGHGAVVKGRWAPSSAFRGNENACMHVLQRFHDLTIKNVFSFSAGVGSLPYKHWAMLGHGCDSVHR